jgi:hypothetical protein
MPKRPPQHFGVGVPVMRSIAKTALRAGPALTRPLLWAAIDRLWSRGVHELRMASVELLIAELPLLAASDLTRIERLLRESGTCGAHVLQFGVGIPVRAHGSFCFGDLE